MCWDGRLHNALLALVPPLSLSTVPDTGDLQCQGGEPVCFSALGFSLAKKTQCYSVDCTGECRGVPVHHGPPGSGEKDESVDLWMNGPASCVFQERTSRVSLPGLCFKGS